MDIDKFILEQIGSLSQLDLVHAVEVLSESELVDLQEAVDRQLVLNMRNLHPELVSDLLYMLTSKQLGSKTLITATIKRVELDGLLDGHILDKLEAKTIC